MSANPLFSDLHSNLLPFLLKVAEGHGELLNNPWSNIECYKMILAKCRKMVRNVRSLPDIYRQCKCHTPTIASYLLNLKYSRSMFNIIFQCPNIIVFPKNLVCMCYDYLYMIPLNIASIMTKSKDQWVFNPARFPSINISLLPEIFTPDSIRWLTVYKQSFSSDIKLVGRTGGIYNACLNKYPRYHYYDTLSPWFLIIGFEKFLYLLKYEVFTQSMVLSWILKFLFSFRKGELDRNMHYFTIETVGCAFQILEYLSNFLDFRHFYYSEYAIYLRTKFRSDWVDLISIEYDSVIIASKEYIDLGYTKERLLKICHKSFKAWSPNTHLSLIYSSRFRKQVITMFLIQKRYSYYIDKGVLLMIISYMAYNDTVITNKLVADPRFAKYTTKKHLDYLGRARYVVELSPYIEHDFETIFNTILVEDGILQSKEFNTREEFVENIVKKQLDLVRNIVHIHLWLDIFSYYKIEINIAKYKQLAAHAEFDNCKIIIGQGCRKIIYEILNKDGFLKYDFIEKAKKATLPQRKKQKIRNKELE
jgi:hypothetical protein